MKKSLTLLVAAGLLVAAIGGASAGKKKPVDTTLYMHGNYPIGEGLEVGGNLANAEMMTMDATEPATGAPKSMGFFQPGNDQCTGNPLFPSWYGQMAGTITGDVKFMVNTVAAPSQVVARIWADVPFASCTSSAAGTDAYVEPNAEVVVDVPPGANEIEVVFEKLKLKVTNNIIVELLQTSPANQGRVLYDSPEFATRIEFKCIPMSGTKCA